MLNIPEEITIRLVDERGHPFRLDNVVIGIRTFATQKNDIDLFPFYTNSEGQVHITKKEIKAAADRFIDLNLMDYSSVESARPNIEIYVWTNVDIERYIKHWEPIVQRTNYFDTTERKTLEKFKTCNNKDLHGLLTDNWDGRQTKYRYSLKIFTGR